MANTTSVLEKYESIDQSKLSKDLSSVLIAMKRKSKNFTSEKENKVFEPQLDKIIATLKRKYPEAVKGGVNKTAPTKKTPKNKIEEALESLDAIIDKDPILKGFRGSDIQRDATRKAKPAGKRISKDGNVYYEYRENRTDRLAPNFPKNRPFLERGGEIVDGYDVEEVYASFVEAGLWASYDDDEEPLEDNYSITDVDIESASNIMDGIKKFIAENKEILKRNNISADSLGHDLFLTSQGHGAGFWDRGYDDEDGKTLSDSSEKIFASDPPYVGDDGVIYFSDVKLAKGGIIKKGVKVKYPQATMVGTIESIKPDSAIPSEKSVVVRYPDGKKVTDLLSSFEVVSYSEGGHVHPEYVRGKNYPVKNIRKADYEKYNLEDFPNFSSSGSISGMKKQYYGKDALLVKCGSYIYNVTSKPEIYFDHSYEKGGNIPSFVVKTSKHRLDETSPKKPKDAKLVVSTSSIEKAEKALNDYHYSTTFKINGNQVSNSKGVLPHYFVEEKNGRVKVYRSNS